MIAISLGGFFTVADVEAFGRELAAQRRLLRCARNQHLTLCDVSAMKIQTQEVVAAFAALAGDPAGQSRRMAMIVGSSLARLQTQRVASRDATAMFRDAASAEDWLFEEERPALRLRA
ncbi:hypothetical protein Q5H91_03395 [Sphingomonas sp. KR1UV-12]|uniref:STAS/SEC14 domain-containing protein n=1 Tax=Sphingomonas aurea TaxID=3063994 RepID=A0ABT9EGZ8_9SPHN|nr:hypothetical protein [Sphingomonas sp. KR1UV-12]MDP1026246.1 hypothetical protein [Sphingomonas sp. KR1UV-12]